jgi:DNA-binding IclR family transcriptional regulator
VDSLGLSAHLAVLHGSDVVYLVEERARGRARLVTDVGVRMPAHLAASGRAILAGLPTAQIRALYPHPSALVRRTEIGPRTLAELRAILARTRRNGYADEDSEITEGFASVAVAIPSVAHYASVAVTWQTTEKASPERDLAQVLAELRTTAATISDRLR